MKGWDLYVSSRPIVRERKIVLSYVYIFYTRSSYIFFSSFSPLFDFWFFYALPKKILTDILIHPDDDIFYKLSLLLYSLSLSLSSIRCRNIPYISWLLHCCRFFWLDATNTRIFCVWHSWALRKKIIISPYSQNFLYYTHEAHTKKNFGEDQTIFSSDFNS